ncbi:MAG: S66 peptidase family protein [Lachnospiraceae bacterium]
MKIGDKVGIVCCSNGQPIKNRETILCLKNVLENIGLIPVFSNYIYAKDSVFSGTAIERAQALMEFYMNFDVKAIFDISGGDISNEILPYLDFNIIAENPKQFWGYSDLTTILNAIYTKTRQTSVLYQVRNLVYEYATLQQKSFQETVLHQQTTLYEFPYEFVQGTKMEGIIVGGNIRCFLKLAGTEFFPDLQNKILFLEARGGQVPQMVTFLSQLKMLGTFDKIKGILLGTFTEMEKVHALPDIISLVKSYAPNLPIAQTKLIGHGADSKGIVIGQYRIFTIN